MPTEDSPNYRQQRRQRVMLVWLVVSVAMFAHHARLTESFNWLLYDTSQLLSHVDFTDDIVIVDIDDQSLTQLGRWPWSRLQHARLLDKLDSAGARAVAFDVIFADAQTDADASLAAAIGRFGGVVLPLHFEQLGPQGQMLEVLPTEPLAAAAAGLGHIHVNADRDGIVRSVFLQEGVASAYWPHLALALARLTGQSPLALPGGRIGSGTESNLSSVIVRDYYNLLPMPAADQGLLYYSYADILSGNFEPEALSDKIVLVGATAAGLGDYLSTPVGTMAGVEWNAWVFAALRSGELIEEISPVVTLIVNGLLVVPLLLVLARLNPRAFLLASVTVVGVLLSLSVVLLLCFRWWLPLVPAVLAVLLFYPLWSWLRLELALRYLRYELKNLTLDTQNNRTEIAPVTAQLDYLQLLGLVSTWRKLQADEWVAADELPLSTVSGVTAVRLADGVDASASRVAQIVNAVQARDVEQLRGVELIGQTIARITAARDSSALHQRLVAESLEELQDAVVIADVFGQILFANKTFRGLSDSEKVAVGAGLLLWLESIILAGEQSWMQVLGQLYREGGQFAGEAEQPRLQRQLYCQCRLVSIGGNTDTVIITLTDITLLKQAEKSRMDALNFLSHDLRSPMVSVLALLARYRQEGACDPELMAPVETLVRKNLDYANAFLQLSRAESLQSSQLHWCDLHAVIDAAQAQGLALVQARGITLVTHRLDDDAWVLGDADLLERALINLLTNAVKFSEPGTVVEMALTASEAEFIMTVSDHGCGIAAAEMDRLFERYQRGAAVRDIAGMGLGLHFVRTVIRRHGGDVGVTSELGRGTCFSLNLPRPIHADLASD